jgi:hypothetical protein
MGLLQLFLHLLSFFAPALAVAVAVAFGARWIGAAPQPLRWWVQVGVNFTAGALALGAGLWAFGVDGKMASYAALVGAIATSQWVCGRAWKA